MFVSGVRASAGQNGQPSWLEPQQASIQAPGIARKEAFRN